MIRRYRGWIRLAALIGALLVWGARALPCPAAAETAAEAAPTLEISCAVKPESMVAPGEASLTFTLSNSSDRPVQNVFLATDDGLLSEPVGQLGPGETQTLVRPHAVTQEELDAGRIAYTVSHDSSDPYGEKITYALEVPILKGEALPGVDFTRQISSDHVAPDGLVTVTYKIRNAGNVALTGLRIRDSLGDFTGRLEQLAVGESKTFISRVTVTEESVSEPVLEYQAGAGRDMSQSLDPATIHIAQSDLSAAFTVGRSVFENDTADAILVLTNRGNVDYGSVTVTDDIYGGVIADVVTLPGGGSPVEVAYTYPIRGETQYRWRITGISDTGEALDMLTDTVTLSGAPADETVDISMEASARTPKINRAGYVTFDFSIANAGTVMARDALLYEVSRGEIRRLAVLPTGQPIACTASYDVRSDGQFIFCLNYTDAQGRQRTISSAPIEVTIAADGEPPEQPDGRPGQLQGESVKMGGNSSAFVVLLVIAGAALTVMITILLVVSVRARRDRKQRIAAEKQRIKEEMGRTNPFTPVKAKPAKKKKKA